MATELRLPSLLAGDKYGYVFHADSTHFWDAAYRTSILWMRAGRFSTGGDGMTQHSAEIPVPPERFEDFCASLATYLLATPLKAEDVDWLSAHSVLQPVSEEDIAFVLDLQYKPNKRQWFSLKDQGRKLSAASSKQHDKRYIEVPEWANGSVHSAFELLRKASGTTVTDTVALYALYDAVYRYDLHRRGNMGEPDAAAYLKLPGRLPAQAFRALACVLESIRQQDAAQRVLSCWRHTVLPPPDQAAEAA